MIYIKTDDGKDYCIVTSSAGNLVLTWKEIDIARRRIDRIGHYRITGQ